MSKNQWARSSHWRQLGLLWLGPRWRALQMRRLLFAFCPPKSDSNKIPQTLQIATIRLPSSRTSSVTRTTLPLFLQSKDVLGVRDLQLRSHRFGARKTTYEHAFFPSSALHNIVSSIQSFRGIFAKFRATSGADTLLFQVCDCLHGEEWAQSKHLRKSRYCSETLPLISVWHILTNFIFVLLICVNNQRK